MNSFSFSEQDQQKEIHCLGQEIDSQNFGDWRGNSLEKAEGEFQLQNAVLQEFNSNVSCQTAIVANFAKNAGQYPEIISQIVPDQQKPPQQTLLSKEDQSLAGKQDQLCEASIQEAQTFYQQTNVSTTICQDSKIQQKWQKQEAPAINEFIFLRSKIYEPMLSNFKAVATKTKEFSEKAISNLDMYSLFLSIKLNQEQSRLKIMNASIEKTKNCLKSSELLDVVYLDEKVVLQQVAEDNQKRKEKLENYCEKLQQSCNKVKLILSKALENRNKKIQHIINQIERTYRIKQQLVQLFTKPLASMSNQWMSKSEHRSDRYIQKKYLLQRQSLFLSLIKQIGDNTVSLLHSIFIKQEPVICSVINKEMVRYHQLNNQYYGPNALGPQSKAKVSMDLVNNQLSQILQLIIPAEWRDSYYQCSPNKCDDLITKLHSYLQNQVFLPTLQINQQLILFHGEAKWFSRPSGASDSEKVTSNNKQNKLEIKEQLTHQILMSGRLASDSISKEQSMKVNVVLTVDKYLHLQCGQKVASLRLKRLKLSKKGKYGVIISEKQKSITTLFVTPQKLGELQFVKEIMAEMFISAVLKVPS